MNKSKFDKIKENNTLLYEYVRGSRCHGIETPTSDWDYGGVYMAPINNLIDLRFNYKEQISNSTNDITWYELNRFMQLLCKSNPTMLESLFVDPEFIIYEDPIITELKKNRDLFVTKQCFNPFFAYAKSQIYKCRGLNKKIVQPIVERKEPIDFCFTTYNQGTTSITQWLEKRMLKQEYCGLVHLNNIPGGYSVFYDWGLHLQNENMTISDITYFYNHYIIDSNEHRFAELFFDNVNDTKNIKPYNYRGLIFEGESTDLHCSSVKCDTKPITMIVYNKDGYSQHCKKYKEYVDWVANRNPVRYESNLNKNYDAKNVCECFRLIHMGKEIASGQGVLVNRKGIDREFLLDIKAHKFEYEYLIELLEQEKNEMNDLMSKSTLPDSIDISMVNDFLLNIRKEQIKREL